MQVYAKRKPQEINYGVVEAIKIYNLTKIKVRKCIKCTRQCMISCQAFKAVYNDKQQCNGNNNDQIAHLTHKSIEKTIKIFKFHRTADNVDPKLIKKLIIEEKEAILL